MDNPLIELNPLLARLFSVRQSEGARRVVRKALAYDGVDPWAMLADVLSLLVREVVVTGPTWNSLVNDLEIQKIDTGFLTTGQEAVTIADITLVADEEEPALVLVIRFACIILIRRRVGAIRDAASDDHGVVIFEISTGPHLANVRPKWASIVLFHWMEVEIVRPMVFAFALLVVVRAQINGCA